MCTVQFNKSLFQTKIIFDQSKTNDTFSHIHSHLLSECGKVNYQHKFRDFEEKQPLLQGDLKIN